jgi:hypothetical protein
MKLTRVLSILVLCALFVVAIMVALLIGFICTLVALSK